MKREYIFVTLISKARTYREIIPTVWKILMKLAIGIFVLYSNTKRNNCGLGSETLDISFIRNTHTVCITCKGITQGQSECPGVDGFRGCYSKAITAITIITTNSKSNVTESRGNIRILP